MAQKHGALTMLARILTCDACDKIPNKTTYNVQMRTYEYMDVINIIYTVMYDQI